MPSCEKCWEDAHCVDAENIPQEYDKLIELRKENPCTQEEQAGRDATICSKCGRKTVHQYAKTCVNPECV